MPIVRILHVDGDESFSLVSGHVRPLDGLASYTPAAEFYKHRHSALVGTGCPVWLQQHRIHRLIVSGIRTEQCCETTTRHANDEGCGVDFVPEATLTFDLRHLDGTPLRSADIVARAATVLTGRFATIYSVEQALERATSANCRLQPARRRSTCSSSCRRRPCCSTWPARSRRFALPTSNSSGRAARHAFACALPGRG